MTVTATNGSHSRFALTARESGDILFGKSNKVLQRFMTEAEIFVSS
jgi:hypothetical protein